MDQSVKPGTTTTGADCAFEMWKLISKIERWTDWIPKRRYSVLESIQIPCPSVCVALVPSAKTKNTARVTWIRACCGAVWNYAFWLVKLVWGDTQSKYRSIKMLDGWMDGRERVKERSDNDIIYFQREFTPLHHAAAEGHADICRSLIRAGSNVNAQNFVSCHLWCRRDWCRSRYHHHHLSKTLSLSATTAFFTFTYPLTARVVGAPQMISQPVSSIFSVSTALWDLANSRPLHFLMLSSHLFFSLLCLLPPFTVPCKMVLARPDEWETYLYHFSLRFFAMVGRSSCGPIACWILARTSSLVIWSLYEMRGIL